MQNHTIRHEKLKQFFATYSIHLLVLMFLVNVGIYYTIRLYVHASGCMTMTQIQIDSRCLYVYSGQVYEKNNRASPHKGHPCGTDVTSVMPVSHLANKALYLLPTYIANVCPAATATPVPTNSPTPRPTLRPTATPLPKPTVTPSRPTSPPVVTATPIPTRPIQSSLAPTQSVMVNTATPTIVSSPTNTPIPTQSVDPNSSFLNLSLALPGINQTGNQSPKTPTRNITIYLYNAADDPANTTVPPVFTAVGTVAFDGSSLFRNTNFSLGVIPAGQYQVVLKMQQFVRQQLKNTDGTNLFSFNPSQTVLLPEIFLIAGDINPSPDGDGIVDASDYNVWLSCYGNNANSCLVADFNDDGMVDGTDYNIFLGNVKQYQVAHGITTVPVPTAVMPSPLEFINSPTSIVSLPVMSPVITTAPLSQPKPTVITPPVSFIASITNKVFLTKILDILGIILLIGVVALGILRSKLFKRVTKAPSVAPSPVLVSHSLPVKPILPPAPVVPDEPVDSTFFINVLQSDPAGKGIWVQLTGDAGQMQGLSHAKSVPQGFARIKGVKKTQNGKTYVDISEILQAT